MKENRVSIELIQEWNEQTFKELYKTYYKVLVGYAIQMIGNTIISEDYVQDIFLKLYETKPYFNNEYSLKAYLYNSVRNSCLDYLRHKQVESSFLMLMMQEHEEYEVNEKGEELFFKEEFYRLLADALNKLPARQHEIIMLYLNGKKNSEIAEILKISEETIKTHKKRAIATIKDKFGNSALLLFILTFGY